MKKYIILIFIASLFFTACDPTADVYNELDSVHGGPYHETGLEYQFTLDDYEAASQAALEIAETEEDTMWAQSIEDYRSFNDKFSANKFAPAIISSNFPELKDGSNMVITYNQYIGQMYGNIADTELQDDDYIAIGGTTADTLCFVEGDEPNDYLPAFLLGEYPTATENNYVEVTYRYPDYDTEASMFYMFDGTSWSEVENSYVLSKNDYDSMGEGSGYPGKYNNFSEDITPGAFLPQYLNLQYPYAQAGEEQILVIHYFGGETSIYAVTCTYDGSNWVINFPGVKTKAQFVHLEGIWKFDPTVRFMMNASDFQLIVEEDPLPDSYGTGGYYYGASSYYSNFDIRLSKRRSNAEEIWPASMSDEDGMALIWDHVREGIVIMLEKKFPNAVPSVDGIDVHYFVSFDTFNDAYQHIFYTIEYKCTAEGSPATFEMVTDAVEIE